MLLFCFIIAHPSGMKKMRGEIFVVSGGSTHFYTGHHTGKIKAAEKKNSTSFPMWNFLSPYGDYTGLTSKDLYVAYVSTP